MDLKLIGVINVSYINILPYIMDLLDPFGKTWEYAREISGNSRGKIVPHLQQ